MKRDCDIFIFDIIPIIYVLLCLLQHYFLYSKYEGVGFIADALFYVDNLARAPPSPIWILTKIKIQIGGHKDE